MKLIVLTTTNNLISNNHKNLEDTLIKQGYDYDIFLYGFIFGEQYRVIETWVNQYQGDATHVLYTDCWDSFAIAPPEEVISKFIDIMWLERQKHGKDYGKMLISTEKACFPNGEQHQYHRDFNYPESPTPYKYINGGGCLFEIEFFKQLCKEHPMPSPMMDPDWLAQCFLSHPNEIKLDYNCDIFQTMSHSNPDEWEIDFTMEHYTTKTPFKRIKNKATQSKPCFFHHNGIKDRREVKWLYDYLGIEI